MGNNNTRENVPSSSLVERKLSRASTTSSSHDSCSTPEQQVFVISRPNTRGFDQWNDDDDVLGLSSRRFSNSATRAFSDENENLEELDDVISDLDHSLHTSYDFRRLASTRMRKQGMHAQAPCPQTRMSNDNSLSDIQQQEVEDQILKEYERLHLDLGQGDNNKHVDIFTSRPQAPRNRKREALPARSVETWLEQNENPGNKETQQSTSLTERNPREWNVKRKQIDGFDAAKFKAANARASKSCWSSMEANAVDASPELSTRRVSVPEVEYDPNELELLESIARDFKN